MGVFIKVRFIFLLVFSQVVFSASDPMGKLSSAAADLSASTNNRVSLSGYINGHVMNHDGVPELVDKNLNGTLVQLREASIFADITISESILFSTELEMSYDFSDKNISGREDSFEALFNYYYFEFDVSNMLDWDSDETGVFKLRLGRILVPFLSYNENKPNFKQNLMSQPFTAWQLVPVNNVPASYQQFGWTDTGISANWSYVVEDSGLFDVKFSIINGLGTDTPVLDNSIVQLDPSGNMKPSVRSRDGLANARSDWDEFNDVNNDKAVVVKLSYAPFSIPLNVGFSWYNGAWDKEGDNDLDMKGLHANYLEKDWSVKAEYVKADVDQMEGINIVTAPGPATINLSTGDYQMLAWYLESAYTPYRYGKDQFVTFVLRYDEVDTNDKAVFTPFDRSRYTIGVEWQFIRNIRLRLETQVSEINNFDQAPSPYIDAGGEKRIKMTMLSMIAHF